ncbi:hypothetical protein ACQP2T_29330 [Nonomuraea sp. CA-143628]|uniref:hypothetical protein n=1 Tax=Nonomuraea sp. CA-143628 TaxID=3239997 RepID=UPI003D8EAD61
MEPPPPDLPYQPRSVRFLRRAELGDWVVKLYTIAPHGRPARAEVAEAALRTARTVFPAPAVAPDRYGVGFVIAHDAPRLCYALACWWAEKNEVHQRILSAPADRPGHLAPHPSPAAGCVWELSVTDFERRAWMTHVLANPGGPDLDAYLAQEYNDDV